MSVASTNKPTESRWVSPERVITFVGLGLSIGFAVAIPLLSPDDDRRADLVLALVLFLAGYLLTLDLALRSRLHASQAQMLARLSEVEDRRFGALPLQGLLAVPEIEESVRDIVEATATARAKRMPFLANRTIERIRADRDETLRISQGHFVCRDRREELRLVRMALQDSSETVQAVASLGLEEWRAAHFQDYFDVYLGSSARLEHTRIFLISQAEIEDTEMVEILRRHEAAGVTTWALDKEQVGRELTRPIVIFDGALLLQHTRTLADGTTAVSFTDDTARVRDANEDFASLLAIARRGQPTHVLWPLQETGRVET